MTENQKLREALQAVIAAHDAEMKELGEQMLAAKLTNIRIEGRQTVMDAFAAIEQARQAIATTEPTSKQSLKVAPAPAVPQDSDPTSKEQYRRMFGAACEALGAISDALGCDPEDGGAEPILGAVEELQISLGLSNGILGCLSAAPALQEGEPVMWVMRAHETGQLNPAMPHQKAKHPKIWSDAFPLYTAPSQEPVPEGLVAYSQHLDKHITAQEPVTLTDGQALKDAFEEGYCSRSTYNDVDISDVETEWAKSSAKASIAALREKEALR